MANNDGLNVRIAKQVVSSAVASVSFTGLTTCTNYRIIFSNVRASAATQYLQLSISVNGSTYLSSSYTGGCYTINLSSAKTGSAPTNAFVIGYLNGTSTTAACAGNIECFNLNTALQFNMIGNGAGQDPSNNSLMNWYAGTHATTNITAVQFSWSGGANITAGEFTVYGYPLS
jgi:hypothetical protein